MEQNNHDEYIKREKIIKAIENDCQEQVYYTKEDAIDCIKNTSAENVAPIVHGEWKKYAGNLVFCSVCKYKYLDYIECDNYCGNCGAKMVHEL